MSNRIIDLDAARKARLETKGVKPVVVFGGKSFELPLELPFEVAEAAASGDGNAMFQSVKTLIGEEQWVEFSKIGISVDDLTVLLESIANIYGVDEEK